LNTLKVVWLNSGKFIHKQARKMALSLCKLGEREAKEIAWKFLSKKSVVAGN